ncbi:MAG: GIY-YIG nuclease family protein [Oscillospiraceae bacterium]|nr:GIY-YIG nuclease family protein [Oscillospiraceae bacterium]
MHYYVYILTNSNKNVIYTGVTNDLIRRVYEHKHHLDKGSFTDIYNVEKLVYYEETNDIKSAIEREKQIKGWNRKHKNKLVESKNPQWVDLYEGLL